MHTLINGWTQEGMIELIRKHVPENSRCGVSIPSASGDRPTFACLYLNEDNKRCAVGAFIPDDHEVWGRLNMSNHKNQVDADRLMRKYGLAEHMPLDAQGMESMQELHDGWGKFYEGANGRSLHEYLISWIEVNTKE